MGMFDMVTNLIGGGDRERQAREQRERRERRERERREREHRERERRDGQAQPDASANASQDGRRPSAAQRAEPFDGMYDDGDRDEGGGGLLGMLGSVTDRVTSVARDVVRTVAPIAAPVVRAVAPEPAHDDGEEGGVSGFLGGLVDRASETLAAARDATGRAVSSATRHVVRAGSEHLDAVTASLEHTVERVADHVERVGLVRAGENALHDVQVFAGDVYEETVDLGEGLVEFAEEDLGFGERPDINVEPPEPPADVELTDAQRENARERAAQVFAAVDGLGTDPAALREALRGASAEQLALIRREYWQLTGGEEGGQNMDAVLDLELSGSSEREIMGLIEGGPDHAANQAAALIRGATTGLDTEPEVVREALRGLDDDQRAVLMRELGGDAAASRLLSDQLGVVDAHASMARLRGNEAQAQALELTDAANGGLIGALARNAGQEGWNVDTARIDQVAGEIDGDPAARAALEEAMEVESQRDGVGNPGESESLTTLVNRAVEEGAQRNLTNALLEGDDGAADAARIAMATEDHWYENPAVIGGALMVACPVAGVAYLTYRAIDSEVSGRDFFDTTDTETLMNTMSQRPDENPAEFKARRLHMRQVYNEEYGGQTEPVEPGRPDAFSRMLDDELTAGSADHALITDLALDGYIEPARMLHFAINGHLGSDTELMRRAFVNPRNHEPLTAAEVDQLRTDYAVIGGDLIEDLGIGDPTDPSYEGPERGFLSEVSGDEAFEMSELLRGEPQTPEERIAAQLRRHEFTQEAGWLDGMTRDLVDLTGADSGRLADLHERDLRDMQMRLRFGEEVDPEELEATLAYHGTADTAYRARVDEATEGVATAVGTAVAIGAAVGVDILTAGTATPLLLAAAAAAGGLSELAVNGAMRGQRMSNEEIETRLAETGVSALTAGLGITGVPGALVSAAGNEVIQIGSGQREIRNVGDASALMLRVGGSGLAEAGGGYLTRNMPGDTLGQRLRRGITAGAFSGGVQPLADLDTYDQGLQGALGTIGRGMAQGAASSVLDETVDHARESRARRQRADDGRPPILPGPPPAGRDTMLPPEPSSPDVHVALDIDDHHPAPRHGEVDEGRAAIVPDEPVNPQVVRDPPASRPPGLPEAPPIDTSSMSPADQFRAELFEPGDRPPQTALEAQQVRSAGGGLSNEDARQIYQDHINEIPGQVQQMANEGVSSEEQARRAFEMRHEAREITRALMDDQVDAAGLVIRDYAKFGNPDGPGFEAVCDRQRQRLEQEAVRAGRSPDSVTDADVHQAVIASSLRTDAATNERNGVAGRSSHSSRADGDSQAGPAIQEAIDLSLGSQDVESFLSDLESGSEEDARRTAERLDRESRRRAQEVERAGGSPDYDVTGPTPLDPAEAREHARRLGLPEDAPAQVPHLHQALERIADTDTQVREGEGGTRIEAGAAELGQPATIVLDPTQLETDGQRVRGVTHEGTHAGQGEHDPTLQTAEEYAAESALREGRAHAAEAEAWLEMRERMGADAAGPPDPLLPEYVSARNEAYRAARARGVDDTTARAYAEEVGAQALAGRIPHERPGVDDTTGTYEGDWEREWAISQGEEAELAASRAELDAELESMHAETHLDEHGTPTIEAPAGSETQVVRAALDRVLQADGEGRNNGVFTSRPEGSEAAPGVSTYGAERDGTPDGRPVMRQGVDASYLVPHAEGDILRVATGDRTIVVGTDGDQRRIYSTDFTSCGGTVIQGRLPDGQIVTLVGHVTEDDRFGHHARLQSDAQALIDMGARDLEIVALPGAPEANSTNHVPDDATVMVTIDGERRPMPVSVMRRLDPSVDAHLVVGPDGIAVYEGEDIATAAATLTRPLSPAMRPEELFGHMAN